ncbi:hypothetical protein Hanom_Chr05g00439131 [Helianthus anomalus]
MYSILLASYFVVKYCCSCFLVFVSYGVMVTSMATSTCNTRSTTSTTANPPQFTTHHHTSPTTSAVIFNGKKWVA